MSDSQATTVFAPPTVPSLSDDTDADAYPIGGLPKVSSAGSPSDADPVGGDFAILIPRNRDALRAFNDVVNLAPTRHQQYLHIEKAKRNSCNNPASTDTDTGAAEIRLPWAGHYRLNMDFPSKHPGPGWILGRGRSYLNDLGIDLPLTGRRKTCRVSGRHLRVVHNLNTGFLLHCTDHNRKMIVDGKIEVRNKQRAITSPITGLTTGDLSYILEFRDLTTYENQICRLKERMGQSSCQSTLKPTVILLSTPSAVFYDILGYSIQGTISKWASSIVYAGIQKNKWSEGVHQEYGTNQAKQPPDWRRGRHL